jgi:hypothetical protein
MGPTHGPHLNILWVPYKQYLWMIRAIYERSDGRGFPADVAQCVGKNCPPFRSCKDKDTQTWNQAILTTTFTPQTVQTINNIQLVPST